MKPFNRRNFIKAGALGAAGVAISGKAEARELSAETNKQPVIKRKLGNTGIDVPVVSIGVGRCDSPAVIKGALKLGITHFDTAHVYQRGNSEKMLGEVLKEVPRNNFTIATKVKKMDSVEKFMKTLEESLARLQMEYVDILYLHAIDSRKETLDPIMLKALNKAKESGKAKHLGISTHKNEPEVIQAAIDSDVYEVVLTSVNFNQEHKVLLKEKIDLAAEKGLGIVAMKVMAGGFLDKEKQKPVNHKAALKWALKNENVATTIPSMVNLEQLLDNAEVLNSTNLTDEEIKDIADARLEAGLYCNACSKCVAQCPNKLPIPEFMRSYMYAYGYGETAKAKELVSRLAAGKDFCADCPGCTVQCVKGFNVAHKIADVNRLRTIPSEFLT